jgi:hypothetical protein
VVITTDTGSILTTLRGTIGAGGQALVSLGDLPADLPVGTEVQARLFVSGPGGVVSSDVLSIVSH